MELRSNTDKDIELGAIVPSVDTHAKYRKALENAIDSMAKSYAYWAERVYARVLAEAQRTGVVTQAQDAANKPKATGKNAPALYVELDRLNDYWSKRFHDFAWKTAKRVANDWLTDNTTSWQTKLKRKGFAVKLQLTKQQKAIFQVKVRENVDLIKSIQSQYHTDVVGIVSRNFLKGRDLYAMAQEIKKRHAVTTRRAALIARDQSNKATAQMNAARQDELGIQWAVWVHSSAGKEPRPNHVRAGREYWIYDIHVGIDFGDGFGSVLPGQAIACRCSGRSIIVSIGRGLPDGRRFDPAKLVPVPNFPGAYTMAA
jgi:hypothetical protein